MSKPAHPHGHHPHATTLDEVMGAFTAAEIRKVNDVGVRQTLTQTLNLVKGIVTTWLDVENGNDDAKHVSDKLSKVHLSIDDAKALVSEGLALIEARRDYEAKDAIARAASEHLAEVEHDMREHLSSVGHLLRGAFGAKSTDLTTFGIKPIGGARHRGTAAPTPATSAKPAPGSNVDPANATK